MPEFTDEQLRQFHDEGYVMVPGIYEPADIQSVRDELTAVGLINRRGNDYFGERLIFPLADARGRQRGHGGPRRCSLVVRRRLVVRRLGVAVPGSGPARLVPQCVVAVGHSTSPPGSSVAESKRTRTTDMRQASSRPTRANRRVGHCRQGGVGRDDYLQPPPSTSRG